VSGHTDRSIVIHAPLHRVWETTNDVAGWPQLFTEYAAVEILEQSPTYVRFRLTTHPENGQAWTWVSERHLDPTTHTVRARRVETGPFDYMDIRWEYRALADDEVEMRWIQDFHMKPEAPVDDDGMARRIHHNTGIQMAHIKAILEAPPTSGVAP